MIWKRWLNNESSSIASAASIVAVFSILSRLFGFLRDRVLSGAFGVGDTLDVYFTAFRVPDFLFNLLIAGALSASFIPLFARYLAKGDQDGAWRHTNNVLNILVGAFTLLLVVAFIFSDQLAILVAPGFSEAKRLEVAELSRIMFLAQWLLSISVIYGSALQAMKRFVLYSLAPILYNVGIIIGAIFLAPRFGNVGLAWGVVVGAGLHLALQYIGVYSSGYRYHWVFDPADKHVRTTIRQMLPRVLGLAVNQINFVAMTVIASTLMAGSVTLLQFAYNLDFFSIGIIAVPYGIAAFPTFCDLVENNRKRDFIDAFSSTTRQLLLFMIPATIMFILLRAQIVRVVLGAGAFDWAATITVADTLGIFALSLVAQGLVYILVRGFFAYGDTTTPFVVGLVSAFINIILALSLTRSLGVVGFGVAYSLSAIFQTALLWVLLRLKVGELDEARVARSLWILSIAGVASGVTTQAVKYEVVKYLDLDTFLAVFAQGAIAGVVGLLVYALVAYALRSEEMHVVVHSFRRKLLRKVKPSEPMIGVDGGA